MEIKCNSIVGIVEAYPKGIEIKIEGHHIPDMLDTIGMEEVSDHFCCDDIVADFDTEDLLLAIIEKEGTDFVREILENEEGDDE